MRKKIFPDPKELNLCLQDKILGSNGVVGRRMGSGDVMHRRIIEKIFESENMRRKYFRIRKTKTVTSGTNIWAPMID
jgi:hypothetical protein